VLEAFQFAQEKERANTKAINDLYALAGRHDDYATQTMLHWFITEQVEEEKWCDDALAVLEQAGDVPGAMLMLDERYGSMQGEG
jgi:ferritin